MSQVFHEIEKEIIKSLQPNQILTISEIKKKTGLGSDQVRRGVEWLKLKDLAHVEVINRIQGHFEDKGIEALKKGLPERRLLNEIERRKVTFEILKSYLGSDFNAAIANAKKNDWITINKKKNSLEFSPKKNIQESAAEKFLNGIKQYLANPEKNFFINSEDLSTFESLKKRPNFFSDNSFLVKKISLSDKGKKINLDFLSKSEGAIDVEAKVPEVYAARTHPLKDTIDEIREIFVTLGFTEIFGNMAQPSFWNFDALFTPQDHPARELQDTFYLDGLSSKKIGTAEQIRNVSESHKKGWRYYWDINEARKMVLRTHTTCVTIKHLAENKPDEARVFSLGRVFRNEKVSYKHLAEFNQIEGVVVGRNANLRNLMGIQREFYRRIGITKIKFWPTFFPYTEPSLQTMVYNERLGKWVELFGMGIFRPEVTKPLGINKPVLAWGGGIERIAMLKYGLDDVREFYNNNLGWLRSVTKCQ